MSVALLAPLGLVALAALAIPLAIHLVRRIELSTTDFAALRWISERIRPRRRLRFERPWLLLLRLALLALLAILLARPIVDGTTTGKSAWVLVAPGSDLAAAQADVALQGADWRWLAPGFPAIEAPATSDPVPIASLLREIDADLPDETTLYVVVPEEIAGLDGERPTLAHAVDWHVVPGRMPTAAGFSSHETVEIAVRYAPSAEPSLKYLRAAASALDARGSARYVLDVQAQDVAVGKTVRGLIWLGSDLPPEVLSWVEAGGTALVDAQPRASGAPVWRDADGDVLARAQAIGRGRLVTLAAALSPRTLPTLLDADFPQRLLDLLQGPRAAPSRAPAEAMKPAHAASLAHRSATPASAKPLDPWLALAIALFALIERVVATRRPAAA